MASTKDNAYLNLFGWTGINFFDEAAQRQVAVFMSIKNGIEQLSKELKASAQEKKALEMKIEELNCELDTLRKALEMTRNVQLPSLPIKVELTDVEHTCVDNHMTESETTHQECNETSLMEAVESNNTQATWMDNTGDFNAASGDGNLPVTPTYMVAGNISSKRCSQIESTSPSDSNNFETSTTVYSCRGTLAPNLKQRHYGRKRKHCGPKMTTPDQERASMLDNEQITSLNFQAGDAVERTTQGSSDIERDRGCSQQFLVMPHLQPTPDGEPDGHLTDASNKNAEICDLDPEITIKIEDIADTECSDTICNEQAITEVSPSRQRISLSRMDFERTCCQSQPQFGNDVAHNLETVEANSSMDAFPGNLQTSDFRGDFQEDTRAGPVILHSTSLHVPEEQLSRGRMQNKQMPYYVAGSTLNWGPAEINSIQTSKNPCTRSESERPFKCGTCGKDFRLKILLLRHMKLHNGEESFKCDYCGKEFKEKNVFEQHLTTHTTKWPFVCTICGKDFPRKRNLNDHMLSHVANKPYKCDTCGKGFSTRVNLNSHVVVHTGEKPFQCSICLKDFSYKSSLSTHVKMHKSRRRFQCYMCGNDFSHKSNLNRHIRIHFGEKRRK